MILIKTLFSSVATAAIAAVAFSSTTASAQDTVKKGQMPLFCLCIDAIAHQLLPQNALQVSFC